MLSQADRIAFSLNIVSADDEIKNISAAQAQIQTEIDKLSALDAANKNLFDPYNILANGYQSEYTKLDGNTRTSITEQDIQDAAAKKIQNRFFPNDTSVSVPSLTAFNNVWTKAPPFALGYGIGKNYQEVFPGVVTKEEDLINAVLGFITDTAAYQDIENTSGQTCTDGTCSLPQYTTSASCTLNGGIWTPGPDTIGDYAPIHDLKDDMVAAVNALKSFLLTEVGTIVTNDPNTGNQTQNNTAISNINTVIIPALNTWLAYADFNTAHGQTTCVGFFAYNSNLLAPTKLHSTQLTALQTALNNRVSFVNTRKAQIGTVLGTVSQNVNTGATTGSGIYFQRYGFLSLRLNAFTGTLTRLSGMSTATVAQDTIKASIRANQATYFSILPTSIFAANANGTAVISLVDASFLSVGDVVYVYAENQEELVRGIKNINGNSVVLSDAVPTKYRISDKVRLYKDLT